MSRPLVYLVAVSRHPMLMDDPTARDVLVCMADLAQDRNGGRIVAKCNGGQGPTPCPAHGLDNGYCGEVGR